MNKWADYLISAIRYEDDNLKNSIAYLKVHPDFGQEIGAGSTWTKEEVINACLLYTSDAADERSSVDLGGRRIIKKKKNDNNATVSTKWKQNSSE